MIFSPSPLFFRAKAAQARLAQMTPLDLFRELTRWRWTPLVVPTVGTSALVLLLASLVPEEVGGSLGPRPSRTSTASVELQAPADADADAHSQEASPTYPTASRPEVARSAMQPSAPRRRGFSPPLERPAPPPPPPPPPPPQAEPPAVEPPVIPSEGHLSASQASLRAGARAFPRVNAQNRPEAEPPASEAAAVEAPAAEEASPGQEPQVEAAAE